MNELVLALAGASEVRGIDPNIVRPGWVALAIVAGMGVALFFLSRSFLRQTRKARRPWTDDSQGN